MNRLKEILERKREIRAMLEEGKEGLNLDEIKTELEALETEERGIVERFELAGRINTEANFNSVPEKDEEREARGKLLKESRSITVANSSLLAAAHMNADIRPTFNEVSSLVDKVTVKNLNGGESYSRPYVKSYGEAGYTEQGAAASEVETKFGYADITKSKITAYQEEPEEVVKLAYADYDREIVNGISVALRKKLAKEILVGDGTAGHLVGIFTAAKTTAIATSTDIALSAIDENTLNEIVYGYGGDEDVEDSAVLILNKQDVLAFTKVRGSDKKKVYNVVNNGNSGTIDGVPFIINSACKSLASATEGDYCMAYGSLSNYELAVFSGVEIGRSTDYKFKEGMICHKGVVFAGGNVTKQNGFIRVKKAAAR